MKHAVMKDVQLIFQFVVEMGVMESPPPMKKSRKRRRQRPEIQLELFPGGGMKEEKN